PIVVELNEPPRIATVRDIALTDYPLKLPRTPVFQTIKHFSCLALLAYLQGSLLPVTHHSLPPIACGLLPCPDSSCRWRPPYGAAAGSAIQAPAPPNGYQNRRT